MEENGAGMDGRYKIKGLVEIFGVFLLAPNYKNALEKEVR
jgi:hypothetical protein